jgi:hypothetical protein
MGPERAGSRLWLSGAHQGLKREVGRVSLHASSRAIGTLQVALDDRGGQGPCGIGRDVDTADCGDGYLRSGRCRQGHTPLFHITPSQPHLLRHVDHQQPRRERHGLLPQRLRNACSAGRAALAPVVKLLGQLGVLVCGVCRRPDAWRPRKKSMSRTPIGRTRTAWRQRPPPLRWPHSGRAALVRGMHVSPCRCPAVHPTLLPLAASSSCVTSSNCATAGDIRLSKCTSCSASRTIPGAAHTSKALR